MMAFMRRIWRRMVLSSSCDPHRRRRSSQKRQATLLHRPCGATILRFVLLSCKLSPAAKTDREDAPQQEY